MKKLFLALTIILINASIQHSIAQQSDGHRGMPGGGRGPMEGGFGILKGKIVDETSGLPIEYANIMLYKQKDSSLVTGGITNTKGEFNIDKVPFGRYYVLVKFIGYKNSKVEGVMVTPRQTEVALETVKLKLATENIDEVVVTGQKSMLQNNLDKKVINVDRSINVEGGTALDIMRNIPSVEVDVEGNVSVRGSSNLTILVDGRPSQINSLEELPANIIQSVELITNPSVRYDPDGMSGILNIVLVKKKTPGYHGMVSVNAGTGNKYSGTVNLNIKQGRLNYFANIDYRYFGSKGSGELERITLDNDTTFFLNQNSNDSRGGLMSNLRGGFDFSINSKNTLSFTASGNIRNFTGDEDVASIGFDEYNTPKYEIDSKNLSDNTNKNLGGEFTLNYKKTFDTPNKELTIDLYYSRGNRDSEESTDDLNNITDDFDHRKSLTDGINDSYTFQSDFVTPFGNGGRIETGIKGIIRKQESNYELWRKVLITNPWNLDTDVSNRFVLTDQVYAGYLIYSNTIGKISYQGGIRVEEQFKKADQRTTDSVVNVSFFNVFPSAHIKWEVDKVNSLQISYSKRVNRPSSRDLNPFKNEEDTLNISYGNPWLEPEFTDAYELGYFINLAKTNISTTFYYRNRTNLIARFAEPVGKFKRESYPLNLNSGSTLGFEIIGSQKITNWWRVNGSYNYYKAKINDDKIDEKASESYSWTAKITSSFSIGKDLELQLNGNYRSPAISGLGGSGGHGPGSGGSQGKTNEIYSLDLGLRYLILKKKGTLTLRVSDVFDTRKFVSTSWSANQTSYNQNFHESRIIFIGFSYRINDFKQRRENRMDENNDFENQ